MILSPNASTASKLIAILTLTLLPFEYTVAGFLPPAGVALADTTLQNWEDEYNKKKRQNMLPVQSYETIEGKTFYLNSLILENSPYLLQHSNNPIDWQSWSKASFAKAAAEKKLVLLSIGYSTCHWCHVMNRESFSDPSIGELLNRHFVAIKVDREEMPAIDQYYSGVLAMIKGSSGWPLTAILDDSGRPIFLETYLDPEALVALLNRVVDLAKAQPLQLKRSADFITSVAGGSSRLSATDSSPITTEELQQIVEKMLARMDTVHGGIIGPQKFPNESSLEFFLAAHSWYKNTDLQKAINLQLTKMLTGGLYDPINGGFFRYSTDPQWTIPHYEKMLYNQALLLGIYSQAAQRFNEPLYQWLLVDLVEFLEQWLYEPGSGYYSAINADSNDREGFYYTWEDTVIEGLRKTDIEIAGLATYEAPGDMGLLGVQLRKPHTMAAYKIRNGLKQKNSNKARPFIDKKIITAWNAAVISGLVAAQQATRGNNKAKEAARLEQQGHKLWVNMYSPEEATLYRTQYSGLRDIPGVLEDYAYFLRALVDLYDITFDKVWLERSGILAEQLLTQFSDENGKLTNSSKRAAEEFPGLVSEISDGELPAADAVALGALWRLSLRNGDQRLKKRLLAPLAHIREKFRTQPFRQLYAGNTLAEIDLGSVATRQYFAAGNGKMELAPEIAVSSPGDSCILAAINVSLEPGWHVNSASPMQDYLRPTKVSIGTQETNSVAVEFPQAKIIELGFQKEPLSVYDGDFQVRIQSNSCKAGISLGQISVEIQACTDSICLAPETLRVIFPET